MNESALREEQDNRAQWLRKSEAISEEDESFLIFDKTFTLDKATFSHSFIVIVPLFLLPLTQLVCLKLFSLKRVRIKWKISLPFCTLHHNQNEEITKSPWFSVYSSNTFHYSDFHGLMAFRMLYNPILLLPGWRLKRMRNPDSFQRNDEMRQPAEQ